MELKLYINFEYTECMRTCTKCGVEKELTEYNFKYKSRGIRNVQCKDCSRLYIRNHYYNHKVYYLKKAYVRNTAVRKILRKYVNDYLLTHPCVDCGETDIIVLEFDHLRDKEYNISTLSRFGTLKQLENEINKCVIRCANCHRRKTYSESHPKTMKPL